MKKRIYDNLKALDCSLLIIAHRLSAIRDSDEILVLDQGKIIERGKHDNLIKMQGKYAQLYQSANSNIE